MSMWELGTLRLVEETKTKQGVVSLFHCLVLFFPYFPGFFHRIADEPSLTFYPALPSFTPEYSVSTTTTEHSTPGPAALHSVLCPLCPAGHGDWISLGSHHLNHPAGKPWLFLTSFASTDSSRLIMKNSQGLLRDPTPSATEFKPLLQRSVLRMSAVVMKLLNCASSRHHKCEP